MSTAPTAPVAAANALTPPRPVEPMALRLLRSAVAIGLVLAVTFLIGIAVIGWVPLARAVFTPLFINSLKDLSGVAVGFTTAFIVLVPIAIFAFVLRRRRLTWTWLALAWAGVIPVYLWLARDEPAIRRPLRIEEIAPAFAGAEKSHEVLMRYSVLSPSAEARAFSGFKPAVRWSGTSPHDGEKWSEFVRQNRAALEADWTALGPQRQWLAELNAFDRIGDLTPVRHDANTLRFDVWRALSRNACAIASLQALDGRHDEAIGTLLPCLEVSRKLEPSSRTLVRSLSARHVQRWSIETTAFVLDRGTISSDMRARLAAALAGGKNGAGARHLILIEYPAFASVMSAVNIAEQSLDAGGWHLPGPMAWLSRFVVNPVATVNRYGDFLYDLASYAETRDVGKLTVRGYDFAHAFMRHDGPKNLGGGALLNLVTPSFEKLIRNYWELEDLRVALHARVVGPATPL